MQVTAKRLILMDEVDGMAGNEDRGGIAELIALLKTAKVRILLFMPGILNWRDIEPDIYIYI